MSGGNYVELAIYTNRTGMYIQSGNDQSPVVAAYCIG